mmetsp:Transcript_15467/g.19865  ORF Transcript_15467/g.19865 Transcript_15467/m.19865 type:complete len:94 (-) Transcript_15467:330-611(-)
MFPINSFPKRNSRKSRSSLLLLKRLQKVQIRSAPGELQGNRLLRMNMLLTTGKLNGYLVKVQPKLKKKMGNHMIKTPSEKLYVLDRIKVGLKT